MQCKAWALPVEICSAAAAAVAGERHANDMALIDSSIFLSLFLSPSHVVVVVAVVGNLSALCVFRVAGARYMIDMFGQ